jgi:hypothetical protein
MSNSDCRRCAELEAEIGRLHMRISELEQAATPAPEVRSPPDERKCLHCGRLGIDSYSCCGPETSWY